MDNKALKILIACPTFGLEPHPGRWLGSLLVIIQDLRRAGIDHGFLMPYRLPIHKAENLIVKTALTNGYTHILRLDDDIWGIRPGDVIKLLDADKDFISGVMFIRGFPYSRCAFRKVNPKMTLLECERKGRDALMEVDGTGTWKTRARSRTSWGRMSRTLDSFSNITPPPRPAEPLARRPA